MGRWAAPEEASQACVFLVSDAILHTGQHMAVDGAITSPFDVSSHVRSIHGCTAMR